MVSCCAESCGHLVSTASRIRATWSPFKVPVSVITVTLAPFSSRATRQSAKPLALIRLSSSAAAVMLLTWADFEHENRRLNLHNTLERLLELGAIPIINENDPISCEEYSLGDNDTLAALVAECIHADLVILLSDIDGLYTADPHTHTDA